MMNDKHNTTWPATLLTFLIILISSACGLTRYDSITPSANDLYAPLQKQPGSEYRMITTDTLRIKYKELYESSQLQYTVYDDRHKAVQRQTDFPVVIRYGTNYLDIILVNLVSGSSVSEGRYLLEVSNAKNYKEYLPFYLK